MVFYMFSCRQIFQSHAADENHIKSWALTKDPSGWDVFSPPLSFPTRGGVENGVLVLLFAKKWRGFQWHRTKKQSANRSKNEKNDIHKVDGPNPASLGMVEKYLPVRGHIDQYLSLWSYLFAKHQWVSRILMGFSELFQPQTFHREGCLCESPRIMAQCLLRISRLFSICSSYSCHAKRGAAAFWLMKKKLQKNIPLYSSTFVSCLSSFLWNHKKYSMNSILRLEVHVWYFVLHFCFLPEKNTRSTSHPACHAILLKAFAPNPKSLNLQNCSVYLCGPD